MKKLMIGLAVCCLGACKTQTKHFDAVKNLKYCSSQVNRSLDNLLNEEGTFEYSMEPRNILDGEFKWSLRKASPEEWCSGFWPGILWMDYSVTKDEKVRKAAEGYTEALSIVTKKPVFDHDIGFLMLTVTERAMR